MATNFTQQQQAVLELMHEPLSNFLSSAGINYKINRKGWYEVDHCPWCGHGVHGENGSGKPNWQCAFYEFEGNHGAIHGLSCMHPVHSPTAEEKPHFADLLAHMNKITHEEAAWVKSLKDYRIRSTTKERMPKKSNGDSAVQSGSAKEDTLKDVGKESLEKNQRRLRDHSEAMKYLLGTRGYTEETISHFCLGLSQPYMYKEQLVHSHALVAPLLSHDNKFKSKYVNYVMPGVTVDKRDPDKRARSWSPGRPECYYSGTLDDKTDVFVCDGLKDLWALWQLIQGTDLADTLLLVSSTNGGGVFPAEWKDPEYWDRFQHVYLGHDNDPPDPKTGRRAGDFHAQKLTETAIRETLRVRPPVSGKDGKDWNDWLLKDATPEEFRRLLEAAKPVVLDHLKEIKSATPQVLEELTEGRFAYKPISIGGAYHNGHLYHSASTYVRKWETMKDKDGNEHVVLAERQEVIVIRSDATQWETKHPSAGAGKLANRVLRLGDGTLIDAEPQPNPFSTWDWDEAKFSILNYLEGVKNKPRPLREILNDIIIHLKASVWLPLPDDYYMLAFIVVVTYAQAIFDAVPLVMVTGAKGSGKSRLSESMAQISANCPPTLGVTTAAAIATLVNDCKGLTVLDDLERLGTSKHNSDAQFDELQQALKLSYNKATATKIVTNMKTGKLEKKNFFGVKIINNTQGVGEILGSRMLHIETRTIPTGITLEILGLLPPYQIRELRNELHTWVFMNVARIAETYKRIFPRPTDRNEEITAPLRVFADIAADTELTSRLSKALERQEKRQHNPDGPEEVLHEALEKIVYDSILKGVLQTYVSITQLVMEMLRLVDNNYGKNSSWEVSAIESPEWVSRELRQKYAPPGASPIRGSMYGKSLRAWPLSEEFLKGIVKKAASQDLKIPEQKTENWRVFCEGCFTCPYANHCEMRAVRQTKEGTNKSQSARGLAGTA